MKLYLSPPCRFDLRAPEGDGMLAGGALKSVVTTIGKRANEKVCEPRAYKNQVVKDARSTPDARLLPACLAQVIRSYFPEADDRE